MGRSCQCRVAAASGSGLLHRPPFVPNVLEASRAAGKGNLEACASILNPHTCLSAITGLNTACVIPTYAVGS
jgi:hypothetical protein